MKFVRFSVNNTTQIGVYTQDEREIIVLQNLLQKECTSLLEFISQVTEKELTFLQQAVTDKPAKLRYINAKMVTVLAPVKRPIHDIICVGVNYVEHLEETRRALNRKTFDNVKKSVYFTKRGGGMLGPNDTLSARFDLDEKVDYEAELAVIIGKGGRDISYTQAEEHIFGYTVLNDLSSRGIQNERVQWFLGKGLDGYCAMGPVVVHKSALPFPLELNIQSEVNGELRQHSNTKLMIHDVPAIIADLSKHIVLEPGDIIATGTPSGVGLGFDPPKFLKSGDCVTCTVEGIGSLTTKIE